MNAISPPESVTAGDEALNQAVSSRTMFQPISSEEWGAARLSPDCIVKNYLFADVALLIAPGGVGKTTLILYEAIHIVLGLPLYGREIERPGPVVILTAEDGRDLLVARLNRITRAMNLTEEQSSTIRRNVLIEYVGNSPFRLTEVAGDVVVLSPLVDGLISKIEPLKPSLIVIDPAVSFGVGESRVNDAEQALVMAARRIRDAINCCVRYIHHTGKSNARDKTADQYSGRGGSAFADGARMVAVLNPMEPGEWIKATGEVLPLTHTGLQLSLPKLSYSPPQDDILIERNAFLYTDVKAKPKRNGSEEREAHESLVLEFLTEQCRAGVRYSKNQLETCGELDLSRKELREAITRLCVDGRLNEESGGRRGGNALIPKSIADDEAEQRYRDAKG